MTANTVFFITGVSGTGKSTIGERVASELRLVFEEGDSYHPVASVEKMSAGIPLEDADRWDWLTHLNKIAKDHLANDRSAIISCSALKASYRALLCEGLSEGLSEGLNKELTGRQAEEKKNPLAKSVQSNVRFIYLHASTDTIGQRLKQRQHFFVGDDMLKSQFATLEIPNKNEAFFVDVSQSIDEVVAKCKTFISSVIDAS
ncbi:gluconate kinase [Alteromonas sp. KS69]|jgi:gluconokinase|uniref:gluconokinase n=1 Tax=Alteromonas sp. KS69 TaxID=2109917 RepID=UPI000F877420|nr:AAA family ATPase [Alteromonas sp. KS69]RUP76478.1 gluconate kinase [Alteromonas sp. KS69]|tara:strand:+ start:530 stop:1135 length:606 start_codon:yes stop_codon:yes gene_type:complete